VGTFEFFPKFCEGILQDNRVYAAKLVYIQGLFWGTFETEGLELAI